MKTKKCSICKKVSGEVRFGFFICANCKPVQHICCTSAEDGVKYGIPGKSIEVLRAAEKYEWKTGRRATLLAAISRSIRKLERKEK